MSRYIKKKFFKGLSVLLILATLVTPVFAALIQLPAANTWNLATGLEEANGSIQLQVGSGGFDANSLDMTVVPSSPWTSFGGELAAVRDGEILEIDDDSGANNRSFEIFPADWNEDLSVGLSVHVKARGVFISSIGQTNNTLRFGDASNSYQVRFGPELIRLVGSTTTDFDIAKYPFPALFMSIDSNVASLWIFNTITQVWDLLVSGRTSAAVADDRMAFGAFNTSGQGRSFWKLLQWKAAIEATPFKSTSPVAEMASALTVGVNIDQIDVAETTASGADIKYQWDTGAGYNGIWNTLTFMQTTLVNTSPATLRIKSQFNSDGVASALVDLNGTQSVVGASGGGGEQETYMGGY